ncbi:hypothetical protein EKN56_06720 [Limnobaculum zhutongyuii]|uniref:Lipocalin-like domain-containing protein n=1 Tax=Limnobaculum zhutongyuii TaxID=2498113 RepID=A0A411WIU3_9GAMM|nr:hypothetical protein [Limnobaculum zhutongyuii]QBH96114.1 hypothetical protein EKN56_06720 [Limnobaculum zhutongyuii]TQS87247.1 hypothetical protein ELQ32_14695 [Limnobaculum zhutongyuii]
MKGIAYTKILIISALFLSGCGDDKQVTEDMLVGGEWKCEVVDAQQTYFNGDKFNDPIIDTDRIGTTRTISYFKRDNDFLVSVDKKPGKHKYEFKIKGEYHHKTDDIIIETIEYIYVSDNEYKYVTDGDISRSLPDGDIERLSKYKRVDNCQRSH